MNDETKQEQNGSVADLYRLTQCPEGIRTLDPHAEHNWIKFLRNTGVTMDTARKQVIDGSKRAWVIRNLGIPSLLQRLPHAKTEIQRARVWWRESAACGAGESIPDLSTENMHVLNPFILTKSLKFKNERFEILAKQKQEREQIEQVQKAKGARYCANTTTRHFLPLDARSNAHFCDRACRQEAYRRRKVA